MILSNDNINGSAFCKNHNIDIHVIFVYLADEKIRIRPWSALFLYFILQT